MSAANCSDNAEVSGGKWIRKGAQVYVPAVLTRMHGSDFRNSLETDVKPRGVSQFDGCSEPDEESFEEFTELTKDKIITKGWNEWDYTKTKEHSYMGTWTTSRKNVVDRQIFVFKPSNEDLKHLEQTAEKPKKSYFASLDVYQLDADGKSWTYRRVPHAAITDPSPYTLSYSLSNIQVLDLSAEGQPETLYEGCGSWELLHSHQATWRDDDKIRGLVLKNHTDYCHNTHILATYFVPKEPGQPEAEDV